MHCELSLMKVKIFANKVIFVKSEVLSKTIEQFDGILKKSKALFLAKSQDYGPSWRVLRPSSLTDQLYIKAARIRSLEQKKDQKVEDDITGEYMALINYSIMAIIQEIFGFTEDHLDIAMDKLQTKYEEIVLETRTLLEAKNHDYGEAWRMMRVSSFTDLILVKLLRIKQMEANDQDNLVSEGPKSNFQDIINYAVFALIKFSEEGKFELK